MLHQRQGPVLIILFPQLHIDADCLLRYISTIAASTVPAAGVLQGVRDEQLRGGHREVLLLQLLSLQQGPCLVLLLCPLSSFIMVTFYHLVHIFCYKESVWRSRLEKCDVNVFNPPSGQVAESSTLMQKKQSSLLGSVGKTKTYG